MSVMVQRVLHLLLLCSATVASRHRLRTLLDGHIPCVRTLDEIKKVVKDRSLTVGDKFQYCQGEIEATFQVVVEDTGLAVRCGNGICTVLKDGSGESLVEPSLAPSDTQEDEDDDEDPEDDSENNPSTNDFAAGKGKPSTSSLTIGLVASLGIALLCAILLTAWALLRREPTPPAQVKSGNPSRSETCPSVPPVVVEDDPWMDVTTHTVGDQSEMTMEGFSCVTDDPSIGLTTYTVGGQSEIMSMEGFSCATTGRGFSVNGDGTAPEQSSLPVASNLHQEVVEDSKNVVRVITAPPGRLGLQVGDSERGPIVASVRADGPLADYVFEGDLILQVDDRDCIFAAHVSHLLDQTQHTSRKIRLQSQMESFGE